MAIGVVARILAPKPQTAALESEKKFVPRFPGTCGAEKSGSGVVQRSIGLSPSICARRRLNCSSDQRWCTFAGGGSCDANAECAAAANRMVPRAEDQFRARQLSGLCAAAFAERN